MTHKSSNNVYNMYREFKFIIATKYRKDLFKWETYFTIFTAFYFIWFPLPDKTAEIQQELNKQRRKRYNYARESISHKLFFNLKSCDKPCSPKPKIVRENFGDRFNTRGIFEEVKLLVNLKKEEIINSRGTRSRSIGTYSNDSGAFLSYDDYINIEPESEPTQNFDELDKATRNTNDIFSKPIDLWQRNLNIGNLASGVSMNLLEEQAIFELEEEKKLAEEKARIEKENCYYFTIPNKKKIVGIQTKKTFIGDKLCKTIQTKCLANISLVKTDFIKVTCIQTDNNIQHNIGVQTINKKKSKRRIVKKLGKAKKFILKAFKKIPKRKYIKVQFTYNRN